MKKTTTSDRLRQIMNERELKQVDILERCKPYCLQHNVKMNKNDLSQYVSGKVIPKQDKLSILSMALGVNEVWLMGYDVPSDKDYRSPETPAEHLSDAELLSEIQAVYGLSTKEAVELFNKLDTMDKGAAIERMRMMLEDKKYLGKEGLLSG